MTESHEQLTGLTEQEAKHRLEQEGPNALPTRGNRTAWNIIQGVMREPMFLLLLASGGLYFLLGDTQEALMLLSMIFIVMGLTFYQENKSERALEALKELSGPQALVIREGQPKHIPSHEVVRGDLLVLTEGDRITADGILMESSGLSVDESLLTGESAPVQKRAQTDVTARDSPDGERQPFVYSGTLAVQGKGIAKVLEIGSRTEIGKIGKSLESLVSEETMLQKETRRLVKLFALWGGFLCVLVILAYGLIRDNWISGLLAGIALAMSVLPEEFPVVLTVFLALGAWRIAQKQVLARRSQAIETLGAATVLCVDKTGTLTLNKMQVARLVTNQAHLDLDGHPNSSVDESITELLRNGILASHAQGFDPMDKALIEAGKQLFPDGGTPREKLVKEYPLSKELMAVTQVWQAEEAQEHQVASKGAPETIADLCKMNPSRRQEVGRQTQEMAQKGLRVLGVAKGRHSAPLPDSLDSFTFEFLGLIGFMDPLRPAIPGSVKECYTAGIRIIMLTGDYPETAQTIARQAGLRGAEVMTGSDIADIPEETFQDRVKTVNIFARMLPEQKLRLVNALKASKQIVAMTGDGVNDAPALKSAHIGIAMGKRGTDVARETADLILLDDDFSSIVNAIKLGRRIFDNLRKAMTYIFAVHIPIAGTALLPVIFNWPLVLFPVHIVFLELIIDPTCALAFEAEPVEPDVMNRPPRKLNVSLFNKQSFFLSMFQGSIVLVMVLAVFLAARIWGYSEAVIRTLSFITLVLSNLMLITSNLSGSASVFKLSFMQNKAFLWIVISAIVALLLVLYIPLLRKLFYFEFPSLRGLAYCVGAAFICLFLLELSKALLKRRRSLTHP